MTMLGSKFDLEHQCKGRFAFPEAFTLSARRLRL